MSAPTPTPPVTAAPEQWADSQAYELDFWKNHWPYRTLPIDQLQAVRHDDGVWFCNQLGFVPVDPSAAKPRAFIGLEGTLLEVGCGPIGFFELFQGIRTTAIDSLMGAYAKELPYATLGTRGNSTYIPADLESITDTFDFVACSNVLDHTADWMAILELLVNRIRPRGELLLITDTRSAPVVGHTQVFSIQQLKRAARWLGLEPVHESSRIKPGGHCDRQLFLRAKRVETPMIHLPRPESSH